MGIRDEDVAAVKAASDIVNIVSQTTQLRKQGAEFVGRCPFHADNSPSFAVNAGTNVYYCFGCGAKGDVVTYVQGARAWGSPRRSSCWPPRPTSPSSTPTASRARAAGA